MRVGGDDGALALTMDCTLRIGKGAVKFRAGLKVLPPSLLMWIQPCTAGSIPPPPMRHTPEAGVSRLLHATPPSIPLWSTAGPQVQLAPKSVEVQSCDPHRRAYPLP